MKKEFNDLTTEEQKEFLFLQGVSVDLPYTIALIPFIVILLITSNKLIGAGSLLILIILGIGFFIDMKKLNKVYGLN
jgi:hypothetical protein